jgi:hypothetical protein
MEPKTEVIVDYAHHLITLDKLMRKVHDECLKGDFQNAWATAVKITAEGRILSHTLVEMRERQVRSEERTAEVK